MKVTCTGVLPTQWDDVLDSEGHLRWVIQTLKEWQKEGRQADELDWSYELFGILNGEDGIIDVVIDVPEIDEDAVILAISGLTLAEVEDIQVELRNSFVSF